MNTIEEWKKDFKGFINWLSMPRDDYNGIMEYIDEVPTVTEKPQGEWIREINPYDKAYHLKCSVCGKWGGLTDEGYNHEFNFCPNCGADMRKGGAEE